MQIVIDIPSEVYDWHDNGFPDEDDAKKLWQIIKNGTPLPKGHGRLIDADVLADGFEDNYEFCEVVNATPTIIEADNAKSEDK